jgi:multiple sugar transport system ATP-binding protein
MWHARIAGTSMRHLARRSGDVMAHIVFDNVTKRYGSTVALDNVSIEIAEREFFGVFGPPSCGKSTFMRLLLGLEKPDEGRIFVAGKDVTNAAPMQRNLSMVFQNLALFPNMTARENIAFPLAERKVNSAEIESKVKKVAETLNISHILHKPPASLSGGERQRVAIARAIIRDANAYLMDEPIAALDARLRESMRVELKRLQREVGHTFIYVTHDHEEASAVSDRLAIMRSGAFTQVGHPEEIYDNPTNLYVSEVIGAPRINVLRGNYKDGALSGSFGSVVAPSSLKGEGILGIRPDFLVRNEKPGAKDVSFKGPVTELEPLGAYSIVTLKCGENNVRAVLRGLLQVAIGDVITVAAKPSDAFWFDASGEKRLS